MKATFVLSAVLLFTAQAVVASPGIFTDNCGTAVFQCVKNGKTCGEVNATLKKVDGACSDIAKHATTQNLKCRFRHPICCGFSGCDVVPKPAPSGGYYQTTPPPPPKKY